MHFFSLRPDRFILITLLLAASVACGLPVSLPVGSDQEAAGVPTRTPLPTFTSTAAAVFEVSVLPTPTNTPVPPTPTETSVPPTPAPTDTPEPAATDTPEPPPPAEPQQPAPPPPPPPTEPPPAEPPPAEAGVGANGVIGKIEFRDGGNTYGVGEKVFVKIEASLPGGGGQKPFGVLGLTTSTGAFQTSWSSGTIDGTFRHEDGVAFSTPGNHKLWLSICFSSLEECQGPDGNWERFEPGLDVVIQ